MSQPRPPAGFVTIGPGVYISLSRRNTATSHRVDGAAPSVILIFGWFGGLIRHLQHYSRRYAELFPDATQIIVQCEAPFFSLPERMKQERLLPVVEALEALGCLPSINNPVQLPARFRLRVLVHAFSNGGGFQLMSLYHLLSSRHPSIIPSERLVSALILDSTPALGDSGHIGRAYTIVIRNPVARCIAVPVMYMVHIVRPYLEKTLMGETLEAKYFRTLLQPRLLPWMNMQTPRLYIYSKKDDIVPWEGVQQHAEAAERSGLDVRREVYEDSAHVTHARHDPERYWSSILDLWQTAVAKADLKDTIAT